MLLYELPHYLSYELLLNVLKYSTQLRYESSKRTSVGFARILNKKLTFSPLVVENSVTARIPLLIVCLNDIFLMVLGLSL